MNENYNNCHHKKTTCMFIYIQKAKKCETFLYKKPDTFQKTGQFPSRFYIQKSRHFTLRNFYEIFEAGFYIQKSRHFALCDVFIYKNTDTSQKARKFSSRFYIQKYRDCALRNFSLDFWNCRRGEGAFLYAKKITLHYIFICKNDSFCITFLYTKIQKLCVTLLYAKKCTLHYVFIYIIYRIVMITNYKHTYDQIDQIEK